MWIALNISKLWNFCKEQKIFVEEPIKLSEFPNIDNAEIWVEVDERYSQLSQKFEGPIFLSHIKKVIPYNRDANDSIKQLLATFPNLDSYLKV